jgi:uncharacterized protein YraI
MFIKLRAVVSGSALLVASAGIAMAYPATVTTPLNLRTGPGVGYPVQTTMPAGVTVDVRGCSGGWCNLNYRGIQGYASGTYLASGGTVVGPAAVTVLPEYYAYAYRYPPYWRNGYFYYWYGGNWRHVRRSRHWWDRHRAFIRSHRHERRVERRHERRQIHRERRQERHHFQRERGHERQQLRRERSHERQQIRRERRRSGQLRQQQRRHQTQARTRARRDAARHATRSRHQARQAAPRAHRAARDARRAPHRANRAARHGQRGGSRRDRR